MIVLASASPRRAEILRAAGIDFVVRPANVPEDVHAGENPEAYVRRLAVDKAAAIEGDGTIVLAADTTVVAGGSEILGKPESPGDAARMLLLLSGQWHEVITGIALRRGSRTIADAAVTRVRFHEIPPAELAAYAASAEPGDKAGAYAIQGVASRWVDRIEGCYFNVVGLPVSLVWRRLREFDYQSTTEPSSS
ncbi:MAG: Maf family protein [Bryobacteraceae bacterium]